MRNPSLFSIFFLLSLFSFPSFSHVVSNVVDKPKGPGGRVPEIFKSDSDNGSPKEGRLCLEGQVSAPKCLPDRGAWAAGPGPGDSPAARESIGWPHPNPVHPAQQGVTRERWNVIGPSLIDWIIERDQTSGLGLDFPDFPSSSSPTLAQNLTLLASTLSSLISSPKPTTRNPSTRPLFELALAPTSSHPHSRSQVQLSRPQHNSPHHTAIASQRELYL